MFLGRRAVSGGPGPVVLHASRECGGLPGGAWRVVTARGRWKAVPVVGRLLRIPRVVVPELVRRTWWSVRLRKHSAIIPPSCI